MQRRARASHILVGDEASCLEIRSKLYESAIEGADASTIAGLFSTLATEHSTCPSSGQGGLLGTFPPGKMVADFDAVIFGQRGEEGSVSLSLSRARARSLILSFSHSLTLQLSHSLILCVCVGLWVATWAWFTARSRRSLAIISFSFTNGTEPVGAANCASLDLHRLGSKPLYAQTVDSEGLPRSRIRSSQVLRMQTGTHSQRCHLSKHGCLQLSVLRL